MWKAARTLTQSRRRCVARARRNLGVVGLASGVPGVRNVAGSLGLAMGAVYLFAAATTLWLGRRERLPARWPLIVLMAVHADGLVDRRRTAPSWPHRSVRDAAVMSGSVSFILKASSSRSAPPCLFSPWSRSATRPRAGRPRTSIRSPASPTGRPSWRAPSGSWSAAGVKAPGFGHDVRSRSVQGDQRHIRPCGRRRRHPQVLRGGRQGASAERRIRPDRRRGIRRGVAGIGHRGGRRPARERNLRLIRRKLPLHRRPWGQCDRERRRIGERERRACHAAPCSNYSDIALYRAKAEGRNASVRADQPRPKGGPSNVLRVA